MGKFQSTKIFDGFSTAFRQWKAEETHCKYLHGYGVSFKVQFEGDLDHRNWVWDFGGMKRAKTQIDGMSEPEATQTILKQIESFGTLEQEQMEQYQIAQH